MVLLSPAAGSLRAAAANAPVITGQPANQTATKGAAATFTVTASGNPAAAYNWQRQNGTVWTSLAGATAARYTTPATAIQDNGAKFRVVISNSAGSVTSVSATLSVLYLNMGTQPSAQQVTLGNTATFTVSATANPSAISYQWFSQPAGKTGAAIARATSFSYTTPATTAANDQTAYWVVMTSGALALTSSKVLLTVVTPPPVIGSQPTSQTALAGGKATFTVVARGAQSYQWQKQVAGVWTTLPGATSTTYTTPAVASTDNGSQFRAIVTGAGGVATSSVATLTVDYLTIATQPAAQRVASGGTATFSVTATGQPASLSYQWFQKPPGSSAAAVPGATSASYTTPALTLQNDQTSYYVSVTNGIVTKQSNPATLSVYATPPTITAQPLDQSVNAGDPANFSVAAQGAGTLTYQWYKGQTAISGAQSTTYSIPYTALSNAGSYTVRVANSVGNVTSRTAALAVGPADSGLSVWPNSVSRANSDPWIAQNHRTIRQMRPRFLVINFANGLGAGGGDNVSGGAFPADAVQPKAQAFLDQLKEAGRYHAAQNPSAPAFLDPSIAKVVDLRDSNGHANSNLFPRGALDDRGYPEVGYYKLFTAQYAPYWGFQDANGNYLTLGQALDLGYFHEIIMIANQVDGNGLNPPLQVTNHILEVAFVAQAYDANLSPISGEYVKNGIPNNRQKADMSQATNVDDNSMPWTGRSLRIYFLNASRGVGCLLHSLTHEWEFRYNQATIYSPGKAYDGASPNPYMQPLFRRYADFNMDTRYGVSFQSLYAGGDDYTYSNCTSGGCTTLHAPLNNPTPATIANYAPVAGNCHYPPGAAQGYDYYPATTVMSSMETFGMAGETSVAFNYHGRWDTRYSIFDDDCGGRFLMFWYQNLPGLDNIAVAPGDPTHAMLNWWPFMYY